MEDIYNFIENKLSEIEFGLKSTKNKTELIKSKNEYLDIKYLLEIYEKFDLKRKNIEEIISLPKTKTNTSEFRIMEDLDCEVREIWTEIDAGKEERLRLHSSDLIIKRK